MPHIAILTRPAGRNESLVHGLAAVGWQTLVLPALELRPLPIAAVDLPRPEDYDLVIFVSGHAARVYLNQLRDLAGATRWPANVPAATVGPASARVLREASDFCVNTTVLYPPPEAPTHDSEALWRVLCDLPGQFERVLIVRGTQGRDWLADQLTACGARVHRHAAYQRQPAHWPAATLQQLRRWGRQGEKATWLLTSGEGMTAAETHVHQAGLDDWWRSCDFVVTHPALSQRLRQGAGGKPIGGVVKTCLPTDDSIMAAFVAA